MTPYTNLHPGGVLERSPHTNRVAAKNEQPLYFKVVGKYWNGYNVVSFRIDKWGERDYLSPYFIGENWDVNYKKVVMK